ncbi:MAG TPA: hypothetical protein VFF27_18860 [Bacteroidia bacterium]|jgi:hypothetical protein|nr:hypothetical protein [Bacteroidia bacterium]
MVDFLDATIDTFINVTSLSLNGVKVSNPYGGYIYTFHPPKKALQQHGK